MDNNNRVLGRVLAIEEIMTVSGAKATATCLDIGATAPWLGDSNTYADCTQTQADSGPVIDTSPVTDQRPGS